METNLILMILVSLTLLIWLNVFLKLGKSPTKIVLIVGEVLFGLGIGIVVGTLFKYDLVYDTSLYFIFLMVGFISLLFGLF